jgi:hypothetical protein
MKILSGVTPDEGIIRYQIIQFISECNRGDACRKKYHLSRAKPDKDLQWAEYFHWQRPITHLATSMTIRLTGFYRHTSKAQH